ncbi:hypothetical protein [Nocardia jejuensis]|uniref:hypothetical protein n=1 Tax=Nocardia jejuensis TaxID=328049 RepID=UPI0008342E87|nr:hypothetical protein [Nocardia jejuensis]
MTKRSIGALAAVSLSALAAPVLLAAPASANIDSIKVEGAQAGADCTVAATACTISAKVSGTDATAPVTVSVDGAIIAQGVTPSGGTASAQWKPAANAKYTVTITQGSYTSSVSVNVPGRAESSTGIPSGVGDLVKLLTGSAG